MELKTDGLKFYQTKDKDTFIYQNNKITTPKFELVIDFFDYYKLQEVINIILDSTKEVGNLSDITFKNIYMDVNNNDFVKIVAYYLQQQWVEVVTSNDMIQIKEFLEFINTLSVYFKESKDVTETLLNSNFTINQSNQIIKRCLSTSLTITFENIDNDIIPCYHPKNLDEIFYIMINLLLVNKPVVKT